MTTKQNLQEENNLLKALIEESFFDIYAPKETYYRNKYQSIIGGEKDER